MPNAAAYNNDAVCVAASLLRSLTGAKTEIIERAKPINVQIIGVKLRSLVSIIESNIKIQNC